MIFPRIKRLDALLNKNALSKTEEEEISQLQSEYRNHYTREFCRAFDLGVTDIDSFGSFSIGHPNAIHRTTQISFYRNAHYKNGPLYYLPKTRDKFIHYTNLGALESILKTQSLRMYSMNHQQDPNEIQFGMNHIGYSERRIADIKDTLFLMSFVRYWNKESLDMWRLYGNNGDGAAIVFRIDPQEFDFWSNYNFARIEYISDKTKPLGLEEKIKQWEREYDFHIQNKSELLARRASVIKSSIFNSEREYRLIHYKIHSGTRGRGVSKNIKKGLNKSKGTSYYTELEIGSKWIEKHDEKKKLSDQLTNSMHWPEYRASSPRLYIDRVILGYNLGGKSKTHDIEEYVIELIGEDRYPERPRLSISSLFSYFNP